MIRWVPVALFSLSLLIIAGVIIAWGPSRDFGIAMDSTQYIAIAQSLNLGKGYRNPVGQWADQPAYDRMPGWPAILTVALWVSPSSADANAVARFAGAVCLAFAGLGFYFLSRHLGLSELLSSIAGLAIALSPPLLYLVVTGMSEVSFALAVALGVNCFLRDGALKYIGALLLSCGALIRTNFILFPVILIGLALMFPAARTVLWAKRRAVILSLLIFCCLPAAWTLRNYSVIGRFPLLSSIEGETLYGGNNDLVANSLQYWGYWVMPDMIPGETPKLELAKQFKTDLALNDYYHEKGMNWIRTHKAELPRLVLGKLVRGMAPVPWNPQAATFAAFGYRGLLYVLFLSLLPFWLPVMDKRYLLVLLTLFAINLITIVIYWGVFRFTHVCVEIFFVPCILVGLRAAWLRRRSSGY